MVPARRLSEGGAAGFALLAAVPLVSSIVEDELLAAAMLVSGPPLVITLTRNPAVDEPRH